MFLLVYNFVLSSLSRESIASYIKRSWVSDTYNSEGCLLDMIAKFELLLLFHIEGGDPGGSPEGNQSSGEVRRSTVTLTRVSRLAEFVCAGIIHTVHLGTLREDRQMRPS